MIKKFFNVIRMYLMSPEKYARMRGVKIGKNCFIDTRNWPSEGYLVTIGDNVGITEGVAIYTHGGAGCVREKYPDFDFFGKVVIEDWAYIGAKSQIMPGVTIGHGALVAAGSVVTKSVPAHTVVGGNPAQYICTTEEFLQRNMQYNIKTKKMSLKEKKFLLLSLPDSAFVSKKYIKTK